jgi:hypothetical protein
LQSGLRGVDDAQPPMTENAAALRIAPLPLRIRTAMRQAVGHCLDQPRALADRERPAGSIEAGNAAHSTSLTEHRLHACIASAGLAARPKDISAIDALLADQAIYANIVSYLTSTVFNAAAMVRPLYHRERDAGGMWCLCEVP